MTDYEKFKAVYVKDKRQDEVGTHNEYAAMLGIGRYTISKYIKRADKELMDELAAGLTEKERLFCYYFAVSMRPVQSYMRIYKATRNSAVRKINALLDRDDIIEYARNMRRSKCKTNALVNIDDIIAKHIDIMHADITDFVDFGTREVVDIYGNVQTENFAYFKPADEVDGSLIKGLSNRGGDVNIVLEDKQKSLAVLLEYKRAFTPDDTANSTIKNIVSKISERREATELIEAKSECDF